MKILLLDIETAPNIGHVWGLWQQNISLNQLMESGYVLCWSAKWLGEDWIYFDSVQKKSTKSMLKGIYRLLDEADAVVHYNGKKFDIPTLNSEFIKNGYKPPSPYKQLDLLETVKSQFRFPSNKLEYVSKALGIGEKLKHVGHELWVGCMIGDPQCWETMEDYNVQDVKLLEDLYMILRPWIKNHINYSLYSDDSFVCPNCGSDRLVKRGLYKTTHSIFQRYKCISCGKWCKDNKILNRQQYKTTGI